MSAVVDSEQPGHSPDVRELERFLYYEAKLLDQQRWDEWNALFIDEGEYWVPASPDQPDPKNHVSLIYETELLRAVRIKRFKHPNAFSLQPKPRSVHMISNVMLDEYDETSGECVVSSCFLMLQYRRDLDTFSGTYTHHIRNVSGQYRIRKKRVNLVNCDAPMSNILLYL